MLPLAALTSREALSLEGLLFDLDDTLLEHGKLPEDAYRSLFRLRESGLRLVALTGRPAAWAEVLARLWPVEAAIAENGALLYTLLGSRLRLVDTVSAAERAERRQALAKLVLEVREAVPELVPADDVQGRISDFTFDIGEHERAAETSIRRAIALAEARGATTTRSSVHLHLSFDRIDKATGALAWLTAQGEDSTRALSHYGFVGDSQNDASCFAAFRTTFGVANVAGDFSMWPRFRADRARSAGFEQVAERLCELRRV